MRTVIAMVVLLGLGSLWTFFGLPWLMESVFPDVFAAPGMDLQRFFSEGPRKLFPVFWFCNVAAVCLWIWRTKQRRASSATHVTSMQNRWWVTAGLLLVVGLVLNAFTIWIPFPQVPLGGVLMLLSFLFVHELLCFWLPTVLASQGSYRLVVPGAQVILSLGGGQ